MATLDERLDGIYAQAAASLSASSLSTMATASDNAGAGRTLGRLISVLGRRVERAANRHMQRAGHVPRPRASDLEESGSSMATADDNVGAGRTLGVLIGFFGRRLEAAASRCGAARGGLGPRALRDRVLRRRGPSWDPRCILFPYTKEDRRYRKEIAKLLDYVESDVAANQELALNVIMELAVKDSYLCDVLILLGAARDVALVALRAERDGCSHLLAPSRRALTCLVDVDINALGHKVVALDRYIKNHPLDDDPPMRTAEAEWVAAFLDLIERARRLLDVSFLAIRHAQAMLPRYHWGFYSEDIHQLISASLLNCLLHLVVDTPQAVEWETFFSLTDELLMRQTGPYEGIDALIRETISCAQVPPQFKRAFACLAETSGFLSTASEENERTALFEEAEPGEHASDSSDSPPDITEIE